MNEQEREQFLIFTAIDWAISSRVPGIPKDFTPADATIRQHTTPHQEREGDDILQWEEKRWTVRLRGTWDITLDETGIPDGEPRRIA